MKAFVATEYYSLNQIVPTTSLIQNDSTRQTFCSCLLHLVSVLSDSIIIVGIYNANEYRQRDLRHCQLRMDGQ